MALSPVKSGVLSPRSSASSLAAGACVIALSVLAGLAVVSLPVRESVALTAVLMGAALVAVVPLRMLATYCFFGAAATAAAPLIHVQIQGDARLANVNLDTTDLRDRWFCARGKCKCPKGTKGNPPPAPPD